MKNSSWSRDHDLSYGAHNKRSFLRKPSALQFKNPRTANAKSTDSVQERPLATIRVTISTYLTIAQQSTSQCTAQLNYWKHTMCRSVAESKVGEIPHPSATFRTFRGSRTELQAWSEEKAHYGFRQQSQKERKWGQFAGLLPGKYASPLNMNPI